MVDNSNKQSLFDLKHRIISEGREIAIVVCCDHLCDLNGISEESFFRRKNRERQLERKEN